MKNHSIKLLSGLGLSIAFSVAHAASITAIDVAQSDGDSQLLQVTFDGPAIKPNSFAIANPARVAFDFADTQVKLPKNFVDLGNPIIKSAVAVEANGRSRLVLNLAHNVSYSTTLSGNKLLVRIGNSMAPVQQNATSQEQAPVNSTAASEATAQATVATTPLGLDFRRGKGGEGRVEITLPAANTPVDVRRDGKDLVLDVMSANLPRTLEKRMDVSDFATPVDKVIASNQGRNSRILIQPQGDWEFSSYQTERKLVVEVRKAVVESASKNELNSKPQYKGDKLSLNFQNIEVRTVLQVIAEFTGLNIVTSDSVTGNITLRLKDVPWDQALDLILQTKGLDQRRNGNIINIAPREELLARDKQILEGKQQLTALEPVRSETFVLRYRSAEDFKKILDGSSTTSGTNNTANNGLLSSRGSALIDPKTNTLIINDTQSVIDKIRDLIVKTDIPVKQVLIEARIVEATDDWSKSLGVKLNVARAGSGFSLGGSVADAITSHNIGTGATTGTIPLNSGVNLGLSGTYNSIGAVFGAGSRAAIGLELDAMESGDKGKVLANPRIMTADRVEASIEQGTEIPYQEASSSGATSVSFKKANLSLKVTPQITPDNRVLMEIQINKDTVNSTLIVNSTPAIDTKVVKTQVMVENGGTVVIGGIYQQTLDNTTNKVPLLGDIPFLGALFRSKVEKNNRTELLVFITPRVVEDLNLQNR
ncbi:type IV pilus secretin PilQ [Aquitalea magnusonii]|uniref:Type IV pilus biogenesis and competence protein PilQ n=1 Tax=Aquitalea magnusonii TaxID=332411 RepID=A0A318JYN0_9NEIS|nr:type IV pilus secretin PilQ [Aquitalea magnusonii]PXX45964.1 type IV pilus assembly protein PilQ [Aquitalea magnusonii]